MIKDISKEEFISQLNNLLRDKDFLELNRLLETEFNLFQMLKIGTKELKYSKILAWLLDPKENHNLEDVFLRKFLKKLIEINPDKFKQLDIEYVEIDCIPLDKAKVSVEQTLLSKKRLDVFVRTDKWIIVIENKLLSKESVMQTKFYSEELSEKFSDDTKICIYLTPDAADPVDTEHFIPMSWEDILAILDDIICYEKMNINVKSFLLQFKKSIEVYVVKDPKIREICENIYFKYERVLVYLFDKLHELGIGAFENVALNLDEILRNRLDNNEWEFFKGNGWNIVSKKRWIEVQKRSGWSTAQKFRPVLFEAKYHSDSGQYRIFFYGKPNKAREAFRLRLKEIIQDPTRKSSGFDRDLTLDNRGSWLNLQIIEDLEEVDTKKALKKVAEEFLKLINEFSPLVDQIVEDLDGETF